MNWMLVRMYVWRGICQSQPRGTKSAEIEQNATPQQKAILDAVRWQQEIQAANFMDKNVVSDSAMKMNTRKEYDVDVR